MPDNTLVVSFSLGVDRFGVQPGAGESSRDRRRHADRNDDRRRDALCVASGTRATSAGQPAAYTIEVTHTFVGCSLVARIGIIAGNGKFPFRTAGRP